MNPKFQVPQTIAPFRVQIDMPETQTSLFHDRLMGHEAPAEHAREDVLPSVYFCPQ